MTCIKMVVIFSSIAIHCHQFSELLAKQDYNDTFVEYVTVVCIINNDKGMFNL